MIGSLVPLEYSKVAFIQLDFYDVVTSSLAKAKREAIYLARLMEVNVRLVHHVEGQRLPDYYEVKYNATITDIVKIDALEVNKI